MAVTARVIGADKVKRRLKHIPGAVEQKLRDVLFEAAKEVRDEAIREIEKPKHGRTYTRTRNSGKFTWRASAPGEAPARKTGQRMRQIEVKKANRKLKPGSRVKAPGIYRLLERGMQRIAPRPLFGPLMRKKTPAIMQKVRAATKQMARKR